MAKIGSRFEAVVGDTTVMGHVENGTYILDYGVEFGYNLDLSALMADKEFMDAVAVEVAEQDADAMGQGIE
jgi:hypothetical protein